MAKTTIYLRVARKEGGRTPYKVEASNEPNHVPLLVKGGYNKPDYYLPTISFGVVLNIPDELFDQAGNIVAEINVGLDEQSIAADIKVPAPIKIKK